MLRTAKGAGSESSVTGKGWAPAWLLQRLLGSQDSAAHEEHQAPRAPGWGLQTPTPEADSVGAKQVHDRRRFPSTLLPSTDMCQWLGPEPASLGPAHSPNSGKQPLRQDLLEEPCYPA